MSYYICKKCGERFGTTKPIKHGKLGIVMYPYEVPENICDGEILELDYKEYMEKIISGAWERIKEKDKQIGVY